MSSRREDLDHTVAIVSGEKQEDVLNALRELAKCDDDFNGNNGKGYRRQEARKFNNNLEYAINSVKDESDIEEMLAQFINIWMGDDGYYGKKSIKPIMHDDKLVAISLAYTSGC